jgi:hydroxymethylbilane synthase
MRLVLGARRSELARIQAYQVGEALRQAHPQLIVDYSFRESLGDRKQNDPLWQMPEKGVFTEDFREGLLSGQFDLVVHSWKDLAIEDQSETEVAATLPRADARDLLIVRADRWAEIERTGEISILTSSPRRSYNLDGFLRDALPVQLRKLSFVPVRGNVPTRIRKLWQNGADGLVVAKAAIDRLLETRDAEFAATQDELRRALAQCRWMVLPLRANPTAPGQGALAIEIARRRDDLRELLAPINSAEAFATVTCEREILRGYGGGCHQKIGVSVLPRPFGEVTFLRGLTDDGCVLDSCSLRASDVRPPKMTSDKMWPLKPSEAYWFTREPISVAPPDQRNALWISKADALPGTWNLDANSVVWVSGLRTWQRLARRGVWVNGCAESLGELEPARLETIAGSNLKWLKLTHANGFVESEMESLATYTLVPKTENLDLQGKTYFFWTSGSSFERALSRNPWLKQMTHFCGPGNTQRTLEKNGVKPFVFLDHAQWLKEMLPQ